MTRRSQHAGRTAVDDSVKHARSVDLPAPPLHKRGMHAPPQDPRSLYRNTVRIAFAIKCLHTRRAELAVVLDRWDARLVKLRREHDASLTALEHASPELYARAEERRREWDDPKRALAWATDHGEEPLP